MRLQPDDGWGEMPTFGPNEFESNLVNRPCPGCLGWPHWNDTMVSFQNRTDEFFKWFEHATSVEPCHNMGPTNGAFNLPRNERYKATYPGRCA
ncbi:hypothetical protein [Kibdelosporangium phytohabitans]|uniref:Uncharacterized protein n=1 Tax=Kibdelosporangium phytohabitans TaxID=860235 RepID=A0A0N9HYN6_9PSEU|nr:hypothetical protein [Kibdelosporangium phytohabitans]ALG06996.1 hypothetical protein AOZ06_08705 [Kibdelosporangium phytohabitans]MBE1468284.1 hypothetical protein [Kibdelosporangium phytohabitans]